MSLGNVNVPVPMVFHHCPECLITFGIPARMDQLRRKDGEDFYCPAGHPMSFDPPESGEAKEKRRAEQFGKLKALHEQEQAEGRAADQAAAAQSQQRAADLDGKPAVTCPHCGRAFRNRGAMCSHVSQKHGGA